MKILGIVVARGGSKGIPGKNLKLVHNKPLIEWPISAAVDSGICQRLILSTDSEEIIKNVGSKIEVPFQRPAHLAKDDSKTIDVVLHALEFCEAHDGPYDYVLLLQPTSPLVTSDDLRKAQALLIEKKPDTVISVFESKHFHPTLMYTANSDGQLNGFLKDGASPQRRQEMETVYIRTGLFYFSKVKTLKEKRSFYGQDVQFIEIPFSRSVCIDEPYDLELAKFMFQYNEREGL